jgi:hypothetical protein
MKLIEEQLQALEAVAGIEIAPEYRSGVIRNLEVLMAQASLLFDQPLEAEVEPATVFNP